MRKSNKLLRNKTKVKSNKKISSRRTKRSSRRTMRKSFRKSKKRTKSKIRMKGGMRNETNSVPLKLSNQTDASLVFPPDGYTSLDQLKADIRGQGEPLMDFDVVVFPGADLISDDNVRSKVEGAKRIKILPLRHRLTAEEKIRNERVRRQAAEREEILRQEAAERPRSEEILLREQKHGSIPQQARRYYDFYDFQTQLGIPYLFDKGCESEEDEAYTKVKWIERGLTESWTKLYTSRPIIVIMAHGGCRRDTFRIPENTQIISNERSGNISNSSATRYSNGNHIYFEDDMWKTIMDPGNEALQLLEDDGVTRKSPFYYNTGTGFYETEQLGKTFSVACQKLYREGDVINNMNFFFKDDTGAFKNSWMLTLNPFHKDNKTYNKIIVPNTEVHRREDTSMTGIYVFHEPDLGGMEKKHRDAGRQGFFAMNDEANLISLLKRPDTQRVYLGDDIENPTAFRYDIQDGNIDLKTIIKFFGPATYYIKSCKVIYARNDLKKLARQISRRRELPPVEPEPERDINRFA